MSEINAGSVSVYVVPDLRKFKPEVEAKTKGMKATIGVEVDTDGVREDIEKSTKTTPAKVKVTPDTDAFAAKIKAEAAAIAKTTALDLPLTADGERLRREIADQATLVQRLTKVEIPVDLKDATALRAKMAVELDILKTMAAQSNPTVNVDADTTAAEAKIAAIGSTARGATGGISGLTAALLALGPAIVPITGALVGGAGAFGASALAGGAGAGALGASLIGNIKNVLTAQKDLAKAKQDAATASQNQLTANRAVVSSEQQLSLAQGQRKIAQQSLTQAQDAARLSLRALSDQIKGAALAEGDAAIAVRQARKNLNDTIANSKSTDLDRDAARQAYKDALFQLDQVKKRRQEISNNAAKERAAGVEGNAQVIAARQGVASANGSVANAEQSVQVARENAKKATDAYRVAQQSLADTQKVLSGPAAAGFVKSLGRAKNAWKDYLKVTAGPSFQVASKGLGIFSDLLPNVGQLSNIAGRAVGGLLDEVSAFGKSDTAKGFLDFFKAFEGPAITQFGHVVGNLALGVGGLLKAFAPVGLSLGAGLETLTRKFANFGTNAGTNTGFQGFLAYVQEVGPKVADTFGHLVGAAVKIGIYLAPLGGMVLELVDGLAKFIIQADPGTLDTIALAIGGVALAFGKGPLGLAFALGAVLAHKDGFITFLKKAGTLAGNLADAFNSLPEGIKAAAVAAVGVGVVGAKLKGLNGLGGSGGILGLIGKVKPIPVFVTNPGFGTGGLPGVPGEGKPTGAPKTVLDNIKGIAPFIKGIAPFLPAAGAVGNDMIPFKEQVASGHIKRIPDSKLNMDQLKAEFADVIQNGTGKGLEADKKRLQEIQAAMDTLKAKTVGARGEAGKFSGAFDAGIVKARHLNNEVKLIGSNARGSRAEVRALLKELERARNHMVSPALQQGVSTARTDKVGAQLGGEFRGVLSIDKNGVAYIDGRAKSATDAAGATRTRNHRKAATDGIRNRNP